MARYKFASLIIKEKLCKVMARYKFASLIIKEKFSTVMARYKFASLIIKEKLCKVMARYKFASLIIKEKLRKVMAQDKFASLWRLYIHNRPYRYWILWSLKICVCGACVGPCVLYCRIRQTGSPQIL
jgi:hypothetical protein